MGNLVRFDLHLPLNAVKIIEKYAAAKGIPPRTMARAILIQQLKAMTNVRVTDVLPDSSGNGVVVYSGGE